MKLYLSNGITVTVGSQGEVSHEPVTTHIKPNGDVTVLMYPSRNAIIPPTHYSLIFKADGVTPIGTDFATAQAYLIANTVFKTAAGGSVALVRGFKQRVEADGGIFEAGDCLYSSAKINAKLYKEASLIVTPNAYKNSKLYAIKPRDGSGDLTWSRASDKTRVNPSGLVESLPYNLLANSEGNVSTLSSSGLVTNAAVSISGFLNSIQIPISGTAYAYRQYTCNIGSTYTVSMFIEMDDGSVPVFGTSPTTGNFRLVIASDPAGSLPIVEHISGNLYKISATYTALVAGANNGIIRYSGQVLKTFRVSGMQLVLGSISKPYLKTTDRLNIPSIDFTGGGCPSILVEPQRTNLLTYSNVFTNAVWSKQGITLLTNSIISPDGTTNSITVTPTSTDSYLRYLSFNGVAGTTYTFSFYAKANSNTDIRIRQYNATEANGAIELITITSQWKRFTVTSVCAVNQQVQLWIGGGNTLVTGEVFYLWGAQLEAGSNATSYIPTTTAAVTRVADVVTRNNVYTNGFISAIGGTWFIHIKNNLALTRDTNSVGLYLDSGLGQNGFAIRNNASNSRLNISKYVSAVRSDLLTTSTDEVKIAIKWNGITADIFVNGVKIISSSSFTTTAMENLSATASDVPKSISSMFLFNSPLSEAELIQLTTI